jgi:hypothetical protein
MLNPEFSFSILFFFAKTASMLKAIGPDKTIARKMIISRHG